MQIDLTGKTALVTGASRGIGLAIAQAFLDAGAEVIGIGTRISESAARDTLGPRFMPMDADLSDRGQIDSLIARLDAEGRDIDILVNNAGIIRRSEAEEHSDEDWDAVLAVNLDAAFILSRELGRRMLARGGGKVINVGSVLSVQGGIRVPSYAASKGAIAQLTKALANEWASRGVNVNAVAPGYVATDNTAALQDDPKRSAELMARIPAGRWGRPGDIAGPVLFLASDLADFVNGVVLPVDGGWLAR